MKIAYWFISLCLVCLHIAWAEDEAEVVTEVTVQTGKISQTTLRRYVMAYGVVEAEPASAGKPAASSKIAAPVAGVIQQTYCEEGQRVDKGQLLFDLDSRTADALVAKAQVAVEFAQKNFARKQQLNATENISQKLYDDAEQLLQTARQDLLAAKTQRELLKINAPLSGTMTACHVKAGEAVGLNATVAELIDLHRLNIALHVPGTEASALRLKQPVSLGHQSETIGNIKFISPQVDSLTDTVLVRTSLVDANLRVGQLLNLSIMVEERANVLAVPVESVVMKDQGATIAIVDGDKARQQGVKPGLRDGNLVEIQGEGLHQGMTIVTQGSYGLPPETRIRVSN